MPAPFLSLRPSSIRTNAQNQITDSNMGSNKQDKFSRINGKISKAKKGLCGIEA
jgi:hypothetical protein